MEDSNTQPISVWCHTCNRETNAHRNESYGELECDECQNTFVEEVNQGIENFLQTNPDSNNPNDPPELQRSESILTNNSLSRSRDSPIDHNLIVQQILGRVLGLPTQLPTTSISDDEGNGSGGISIINQISGNTRRPVGIVIRHPSSLDNDFSGTGVGLSRGIFGLLNSISAIRQNHHNNPDALSNAQFEQFLHHILMNESSHAGAPPAAESVIDSLKKINVTESTDLKGLGECCISLEPFESGDVVICLPCGHNYKEEPIVHWLKMHNTCPVCRIEINTNNNDNNNPSNL